MKKWIVLSLLVLFTLAGCDKAKESGEPLAEWLQGAKLDAEETPEELYEAALGEGMLVVYSTSTRMFDVAKSFEEQYEGLVVKVEHLRGVDLDNKLAENYEAGDFGCDVICSADGRGMMTTEFLPKNIAVKYTPYDMADKLLPGMDDDFLMLAGEAPVLSYNEQYYSEPPVDNWWELTEEQWRGMLYMPNPTRSVTTLSFFNMMILHSDEMAQAYEELYGQPLELPEGENAGREFIRRMVRNDVNIINSSDEAAEKVGAPGSRSPYVGIMISSKTRLRSLGYEMVDHYSMEPFCGVYTPIHIMLAGGSKNVNAAKLFVRWVLGEADGKGEGYKPYIQSGAWSVRSDVRDDTDVRLEELDLLHLDRAYLYENYEGFLTFWEDVLAEE